MYRKKGIYHKGMKVIYMREYD